MEKEGFLGIYGIRDASMASSMPTQNPSGLWQAWLAPGGCLIQAVDHGRNPQGNSYFLDEQDFHYLLAPVAGFAQPPDGTAALRERLRPDAPDLLDLWYEQAVIEEGPHKRGMGGAQKKAVRVPSDERHDPGLSVAAPDAKISDDESLFSPIWHPDELWNDNSENTASAYSVADFSLEEPPVDATAGGSLPDTLHNVTGPSFSLEQHTPLPGMPGENADTLMGAGSRNAQAGLFESEALAYEQSMRKNFHEFMEEMTDAPQPELERDMALLLERGQGFNWKQKFMFSEFGLALRRKRKPALALAAHKRALALAPEDENILFNVARAEYELGNVDHAREYLGKALEKSPEFSSAKTFMQFLNG